MTNVVEELVAGGDLWRRLNFVRDADVRRVDDGLALEVLGNPKDRRLEAGTFSLPDEIVPLCLCGRRPRRTQEAARADVGLRQSVQISDVVSFGEV